MPIITDRRTIFTRLAWFGALWASGVLSLAAVAGLLRWVLAGRFFGPAPSRRKEPAQ